MSEKSWTIDELMCTCIARQVRDGDILAQGLATPLVAAGYMLAWHTHAPARDVCLGNRTDGMPRRCPFGLGNGSSRSGWTLQWLRLVL